MTPRRLPAEDGPSTRRSRGPPPAAPPRRRGRNGGEARYMRSLTARKARPRTSLDAAPVEAEAEPAERRRTRSKQPGELAAEQRGEPQRDGERRRRRRGRRGGRRNRWNARASRAEPERSASARAGAAACFRLWENRPPPTVSDAEPEGVVGDFADFNAEPAAADPQAVSEPADADATAPTDAHATAAASSPPVTEQEPPRRRSTVREPAPGAGSGVVTPEEPTTPSPSPEQPVATEPAESENADRPRRTGWWSRRIAGG